MDGPLPGPHSFYREGVLATYTNETLHAIAVLSDRVDATAAIIAWDETLATTWQNATVWVHGDISRATC